MASWSPSAADEATPDPKPQKRHKARQAEWSDLHEQFQFAACCHCSMRPIELHHAVSRARGGSDVPENLVPVCRQHHQVFEDHAPGWEQVAASMRNYICSRSDRWLYVRGALSEPLFDRTYPPLNKQCAAVDCLLREGHSGPHLDLTDSEFQPRHRDDYFEPLEPEDRI